MQHNFAENLEAVNNAELLPKIIEQWLHLIANISSNPLQVMYCFFFTIFRSVFVFGQTSNDSITIFGDLCHLNYS